MRRRCKRAPRPCGNNGAFLGRGMEDSVPLLAFPGPSGYNKFNNRGAKADGYKIRTTESKALFWETAIPEDNGGAGNSELKVYLPDNSLYDDISRLASAAGTTGSYTSNILTDKYTEYPAVEVSYSPEHTGDDELTALVNLSVTVLFLVGESGIVIFSPFITSSV